MSSKESSLAVGCVPGRLWKGDIPADLQELKNLDNPCSKTQCKGSSRAKAKVVNSYSRAQMVQLSWQENTKKSEHPSELEIHPTQEKSTTMTFTQKRTDQIQKNNQRTTVQLGMTSVWEVSYRHHVQPRAKLYMPKEGSGGKRRYWMYFWKVAWTTVGTLMVTRCCQGRGPVLPNSQY